MLKTHYRDPIDFTAARLEEAVRDLDRWERASAGAVADPMPDAAFVTALCDDLAGSLALTRIHQLFDEGRPGAALASLALVGIEPVRRVALSAEHTGAIADRLALLKEKRFAEADAIRATLAAAGILLKDGKDAATGERMTTWEKAR